MLQDMILESLLGIVLHLAALFLLTFGKAIVSFLR